MTNVPVTEQPPTIDPMPEPRGPREDDVTTWVDELDRSHEDDAADGFRPSLFGM